MIARRATSNSLFIFPSSKDQPGPWASHTATVNKPRHHCPRDLDFLLPKAVGRRFRRISKAVYSRLAGIYLGGLWRGPWQVLGEIVGREPAERFAFFCV